MGFINVSTPPGSPYVRHLQLHRPPVNAFSEEFWQEYGATLDDLASLKEDVRAVVISSALPNIFTAGIDFQGLKSLAPTPTDPARTAHRLHTHIHTFQHAISAPERCPFPVIAAVHGAVLGLGVDLVSACDVRWAAEGAWFAVKEIDLALAADIGTLARLPKAAGNQSLVRELAFTGRAFGAGEAVAAGFVSRVVPNGGKGSAGRDAVVRAALGLAAEIAAKSPVAVAGTKRLLLHARDHSVHDNLEYTAAWNAAMLQTEDLKLAVEAASKRGKNKPKEKAEAGGPSPFRALRGKL
ncbi:ClpP/crotonase-like domain-containing protein [Hygrophoropsis aurantiaca]|uniref:ClpP/crotonase-like domain-containing protein n=1 Tax=Hygrophoropsis aurantiaca TaxID=72124 RepID=A0ACB7ZYR3_9AGAM|nr:ClpP/crotonase-like domain-containing protein [Hygrophoropsis aurantiaca]